MNAGRYDRHEAVAIHLAEAQRIRTEQEKDECKTKVGVAGNADTVGTAEQLNRHARVAGSAMKKANTTKKSAARDTAIKRDVRWRHWVTRLRSYAMSEAEHIPDMTADYWRQCFLDGMTPEQAFRESFTEQDGL